MIAARAAELARYPAYGEQAEVKEALQAATIWNYIYTPAEYGQERQERQECLDRIGRNGPYSGGSGRNGPYLPG